MAKKKNVREHHKLHQSATRVVAHGERVREQVRELTERTLRGERTPLHSIGDVVSTMMSGAMEAMDEAVPAQAGNVLREVIGGLTEGASAIVDSSQRTIHTAEQGRRKILDAATNAMKAMPGSAAHAALEAASDFASTVGAAMRSQIEHLVEEARRSGGVVRPAATRVLRAAGSHPAELARETGGAGVRLAVGAASRMMSAGGRRRRAHRTRGGIVGIEARRWIAKVRFGAGEASYGREGPGCGDASGGPIEGPIEGQVGSEVGGQDRGQGRGEERTFASQVGQEHDEEDDQVGEAERSATGCEEVGQVGRGEGLGPIRRTHDTCPRLEVT